MTQVQKRYLRHPAKREEKADPSTARPDAPDCGAKEKIGPLWSG